MGDPELRPARGDSPPARRSSSSPRTRVIDSPSSDGAAEAAQLQGGPNLTHRGDPRLDTADFGEPNPGNLRVDYAIPSAPMQVVGSGVFWRWRPIRSPVSTTPPTTARHGWTWGWGDERRVRLLRGSVAERPNALALKARVPRGSGGSNPSASARSRRCRSIMVGLDGRSGINRPKPPARAGPAPLSRSGSRVRRHPKHRAACRCAQPGVGV
jgi:hypothetical protein